MGFAVVPSVKSARIDACFQIMRKIGKSDRTVGDVFRVWSIGGSPEKGEMPATLDPGPPKTYTSFKSANRGNRTFGFIYVTGIPTDNINTVTHLYLPLFDTAVLDEEGDPTIVKRHKGIVVPEDLPAPRTAELNSNNETTVTYETFKDATYVKLVEGGRRPLEDSDVM